MSVIINVKTVEEFKKELSKYPNQQIIVDFWAEWCGPCRIIGPVLEDIHNTIPGVTVVKVNVDENREITDAYTVQSIPTMMFYKNGDLNRQTLIGVVSKEELLAHIK